MKKIIICVSVIIFITLKVKLESKSYKNLVILGERWEYVEWASMNCKDGKYPQKHMYVIGTEDGEEIFTIQKPNTVMEWREPIITEE